jgi:L-ascorbate metabolism protein UlaG (beta-lactamase superfamily)
MRFKLGRPDLAGYQRLFDVPGAPGKLSVTFVGVSTLCFDDGTSAFLTDGFFSRPPLRKVVTRRLQPDRARIQAGLWQLGTGSIDAIAPVHSHFDHALDAAEVASHTGAFLIGGP